MAVTGQKVYELALALIDEVNTTGTIDLSNPALKTKAVNFLTILQAEILPDATDAVIVTDLADALVLSDRECLLVLPYGLGAHLVLQDDAASASFLQQRYEELRRKKRATNKQTVQVLPINGVSTPVQDPNTETPPDPGGGGSIIVDGGTF